MTEIFRELNYNGYNWMVSNYGNVKHLNKDKNRRIHENSKGYSSFTKYNKIYLIHRMVALAFIPNIENKPQVNHKDGNKSNNHISNLEWVTKKENEHHSIHVLGTKRNIEGLRLTWDNSPNKRKVDLFSLNGELIGRFDSGIDCAKYLNVSIHSVSRCIRGKQKSVLNHIVKRPK